MTGKRGRINARVYGEAQVYGEAHVYGQARVYGQAQIHQSSDYLCIGPLGSRDDMLTVYRTVDGLEATTGCFVGSLKQLLEAAAITHAGNRKYLRDYQRAYRYAMDHFEMASNDESSATART